MSKLLILGTGRSGTAYMKNVFNDELDIKIGHERIFSIYGMTGWGQFEGDATWCAPAYEEFLLPDYYIYHIVRDPLNVLRSHTATMMEDGLGIWGKNYALDMAAGKGSYLSFWKKHCPEAFENDSGDPEVDQFTRCIRYIYFWNKRIEAIGAKSVRYVRNKLEDISHEDMVDATDFLGYSIGLDTMNEVFERETVRRNQRDDFKLGSLLTWDFIRDHEDGHLLLELAKDYGYDVT